MKPYLIQRLIEKPKSEFLAKVSRTFAFGGGGSGMGDGAWMPFRT
jgi:hypothetical protein